MLGDKNHSTFIYICILYADMCLYVAHYNE